VDLRRNRFEELLGRMNELKDLSGLIVLAL
jgi:hypothetical protein